MRRPEEKAIDVATGAPATCGVSAALNGIASTTREWTIASDIALIQPIVDDIVALCRSAGLSSKHCQLNVPVAVAEALANAVLKGNRGDVARFVSVHVALDDAQLIVEVSDEGSGFDVSTVQQSPSEPDWFEREDGRGLFLMRQLMDCVETAHRPLTPGHCLRLILLRA